MAKSQLEFGSWYDAMPTQTKKVEPKGKGDARREYSGSTAYLENGNCR